MRLPDLDSETDHIGKIVIAPILSPSTLSGDFLVGRLQGLTPSRPGSLLIIFTELEHEGRSIAIDARVADVAYGPSVSVGEDGTISASPSLRLPAGSVITVLVRGVN